jgi:hypothetical protein
MLGLEPFGTVLQNPSRAVIDNLRCKQNAVQMEPEKLPLKLFKYVGEKGIKLFENGRILFRRPKYLNDPFDFAPSVAEPSEEELEEWAKEVVAEKYVVDFGPKLDWNLHWAKVGEIYKKHLRDAWKEELHLAPIRIQDQFNASVLCLSTNENHLLMWAHYADSHKGALIEFNVANEFFSKAKLFEVKYQKARPVMRMGTPKDSLGAAITKGEIWKYEEEWRMMKDYRRASEILPGDEGGLFDIPKEAIKRVVLGFRSTEPFIAAMKSVLSKDDYKHVHLQYAVPDHQIFALNYQDSPLY